MNIEAFAPGRNKLDSSFIQLIKHQMVFAWLLWW